MTESDDELVTRLKTGDDRAFDLLFERYAEGLLRHLVCLMGNREEAEDMLHESMMLMIQKINFYEKRSDLPQSFKSWLYRLSTNRCIDEIRKRKKKTVAREEVLPAEEINYMKMEQKTLMDELMNKLPPLQRTVLSLRVHEELSYLEISAICGKDINSVKQGLFQAKKSLKNMLLAHGGLL